jgi:hypothetical protein
MRLNAIATTLFASSFAMPAAAEFARVDDRDTFIGLIQGKTLTRPFVQLQVSPEGEIMGRGARWDINGDWTWQDGFFCRDLYWGGDDLGYNCQEVRANGDRIRFTADRGAGDSADFRLR